VVLGVVYRVDTDSIDAQVLEALDVSRARVGIGKGIKIGRRATGLVVDAPNIESLLSGPESCVVLALSTMLKRLGIVPLPEAVTVGRDAARFGSCFSVRVGPA
jgi:hypothetical protein